jgi:hypothetical protein
MGTAGVLSTGSCPSPFAGEEQLTTGKAINTIIATSLSAGFSYMFELLSCMNNNTSIPLLCGKGNSFLRFCGFQ